MEDMKSFLMVSKNKIRKTTYIWHMLHGIIISNNVLLVVACSDSTISILELSNSWCLTRIYIKFAIKSYSSDRLSVMPGS